MCAGPSHRGPGVTRSSGSKILDHTLLISAPRSAGRSEGRRAKWGSGRGRSQTADGSRGNQPGTLVDKSHTRGARRGRRCADTAAAVSILGSGPAEPLSRPAAQPPRGRRVPAAAGGGHGAPGTSARSLTGAARSRPAEPAGGLRLWGCAQAPGLPPGTPPGTATWRPPRLRSKVPRPARPCWPGQSSSPNQKTLSSL